MAIKFQISLLEHFFFNLLIQSMRKILSSCLCLGTLLACQASTLFLMFQPNNFSYHHTTYILCLYQRYRDSLSKCSVLQLRSPYSLLDSHLD